MIILCQWNVKYLSRLSESLSWQLFFLLTFSPVHVPAHFQSNVYLLWYLLTSPKKLSGGGLPGVAEVMSVELRDPGVSL